MNKIIGWIGSCIVASMIGTAGADGFSFRAQQLHVDRNEGMAAADFDGDGHEDLSAGEFWYPGRHLTSNALCANSNLSAVASGLPTTANTPST